MACLWELLIKAVLGREGFPVHPSLLRLRIQKMTAE